MTKPQLGAVSTLFIALDRGLAGHLGYAAMGAAHLRLFYNCIIVSDILLKLINFQVVNLGIFQLSFA